MNLNAIKALTGAGKFCTVMNTKDGKQWITEGHAAWLVEDVRIESEATIASLFNLTDKQVEKARITIMETTSPIYSQADARGEEPLDELGMVYSGGAYYIGLMSSAGALWINADYLKPVRDDYRQYFVRWHPGSNPIIAVYDDLTTCKAMILPLTPGGAEAVRMDAVKMCAPVAEWKVERGDDAESADGADEGGQERASEQIDIAEAMQIQKEEANA
jgi:hypothetical protein